MNGFGAQVAVQGNEAECIFFRVEGLDVKGERLCRRQNVSVRGEVV